MVSRYPYKANGVDWRNAPASARSNLEKVIRFFLVSYGVSLTFSMAAMEIAGWSTAGLVLIYLIFFAKDEDSLIRTFFVGFEIPILIFSVVVALGLLVHAPQADFIYAFGRIRNLFLFIFIMWALQLSGDLRKIIFPMMGAAALVGLYAVVQHIIGYDWWRQKPLDLPFATGFFNHHLTFAHAFAMLLFIPFSFLVMGDMIGLNSRQKLFCWASLLSITAGLLFSYSRGIIGGLLVCLPAIASLIKPKIALRSFFILAVLIAGTSALDPQFKERALSVSEGAKGDRMNLWRANWQMFKEHPLVGMGSIQNERRTPEYFEKLGIQGAFIGHAHNNYLEVLATTGVFGFLCFLAIIGIPLFKGLRLFNSSGAITASDKAILLAALGAQLIFHMGGLSQNSFGDMKVQHQFLFWVALTGYLTHKYRPAKDPR